MNKTIFVPVSPAGRKKPSEGKVTYSQTSLMRTPKGQNQLSALQRCPYYRGRECMIFGISGTKRTVRYREVSIRRGKCRLHFCPQILVLSLWRCLRGLITPRAGVFPSIAVTPRAISKYKPPGGTYIQRGDFTDGFLSYEFGGLIFGGAYTRRGLFSEFLRDLTYGNIRNINAKEVTPYTNLENLFISHNPLDCDHATTYTLKYVLRETMKLKSFDGHKIKCPKRMPLMGKPLHGLAESGNIHYGGGGPNVHIHALTGHHPLHGMTPGMVATVVFCTILGLIAVAGICWLIVLLVAAKKKVSDADDPVSQMEEGTSTATQSIDTTAEALMKGLQKQRRSSQGFPENAIVDSEEDDVVEEHEYLMAKMKKQRRYSQGYADGAESSDEESDMVEINLND